MQVSISTAAKMVGITRSTLYEHIREKGISLVDADTKRPKIDVSELVRVYGDKVTPLEKLNDNVRPTLAHPNESTLAAENAVLKKEIQLLVAERDRERRQLTDQIENLQESLKSAQDSASKVTALLTDQRSSAEKEKGQAEKIENLEKSLNALLDAQGKKKRSFWPF